MLRAPAGLRHDDLQAAGDRPRQPGDMPHLPAGEDRTFEPLGHAVVINAKALGELLPRQTGKLDQPLPEVLREELRVRTFLPFLLVHSPTSLLSVHAPCCGAVPKRLLPPVVATHFRDVAASQAIRVVCQPTAQLGRACRHCTRCKQPGHQAVNLVAGQPHVP